MTKRLVLVVAAALIVVLGVGTATAASDLKVSPKAVMFDQTAVGSISYQEVTISNSGGEIEHLATADTTDPAAFWPTYGGTCNVTYAYDIPAGGSCTFQWGFGPDRVGMQGAAGMIQFDSGAKLVVSLRGKGTQ